MNDTPSSATLSVTNPDPQISTTLVAVGSPFLVYTKAILAIAATVLAVLAAALTDRTISPIEVAQIVLSLAGAIAVYKFPNLDGRTSAYVKLICAAATAFLSALLPTLALVTGFLDVAPSDYLLAIVAGIGAAGIGILPNATQDTE